MNPQRDELQELWRTENAAAGDAAAASGALPRGEASGRAQEDRLRRRIRLDGRLKISAVIFLGAALPLFAGRFSAAAWGVFAFALLAIALGVFQLAWSNRWRMGKEARPLSLSLAADLELWRRRRLALAILLGATPALAWQVYQLAYLAMNPGRSARLLNLLFLVAGGPVLWMLASWRQWARLGAWLLQIEGALAEFDEQVAARCEQARRQAGRRTALIAALFLLLLLAGILLFWMGR
jgi:hypothetical protein